MREELAHIPYVVARVGFKPAALRTQGTELTTEPPFPTNMSVCIILIVCILFVITQELNKGVRHIKILKDGDVVFDSNLDKGCGNYNLDYGKTIHFHGKSMEESPGTKDSRNAVKNSNSDWLCLQDSNQEVDVKPKTSMTQVAEGERMEKTSRSTSPGLSV